MEVIIIGSITKVDGPVEYDDDMLVSFLPRIDFKGLPTTVKVYPNPWV